MALSIRTYNGLNVSLFIFTYLTIYIFTFLGTVEENLESRKNKSVS